MFFVRRFASVSVNENGIESVSRNMSVAIAILTVTWESATWSLSVTWHAT